MKVFIARPCGFCFGAKRSVDIANNIGKAYSLGPILHNELLVEKLRENGLIPFSFDELVRQKPGKVIIRAHGVPLSQIEKLKEKGFEITDATCSNVQRVYDIVAECEKQGYSVFIYGDKNHPEIIGIASRIRNPTIVYGEIPENLPSKICLVSQTTKIKQNYEKIKQKLREKCSDLKAFDTICTSTEERQKFGASLAGIVDVMLVIGGKESSNTKKLFEVCSAANGKTFLIQSKKGLNKEWFNGVNKVGVTAGASTPDFAINEVVEEIQNGL